MNTDLAEPPGSSVEDAQRLFKQPTALELSPLIFEELARLRVGVQEEAQKDFAHLLNRGSCLE